VNSFLNYEAILTHRGHEVRPINDLLRHHDFHLSFSLFDGRPGLRLLIGRYSRNYSGI